MTPMFSVFTLAIKFDSVFLTIFQSFHLFVSFIFNKLAPPLNTVYVSNNVLNHYLVHCSAFKSLKSAKNVVFFSFGILVDMPMGEGLQPPPALSLATLLVVFSYQTQWPLQLYVLSVLKACVAATVQM